MCPPPRSSVHSDPRVAGQHLGLCRVTCLLAQGDQSPSAQAPLRIQSSPWSLAGLLCPPGPPQTTPSPAGPGACWACCLGKEPRSIRHRLEASCPERDSPGGPEALSRAGKAAEGPGSYILTAPSRQRAHFI